MPLTEYRKEPTFQRTLLKPVRMKDSHRLSFIRTHKDLLLYLMLDKAAKQFLKQRYADESVAEEPVVAVQATPEFALSRVLLVVSPPRTRRHLFAGESLQEFGVRHHPREHRVILLDR